MRFRFCRKGSTASWKGSRIAAISICAATWKASSIREAAAGGGSWRRRQAATWRGSGKDLTYFDDVKKERFIPHVIEPSAGADRATLAFLCEAYHEDQAPDEKGQMQTRLVMKFHPRIAPVKAAIFPLVKKDGMPEMAQEIYRALKKHRSTCFTTRKARSAGAIDGKTKRARRSASRSTANRCKDQTVTMRDRDTLEQTRVKAADVVDEITRRVR